MDTSTLTSLPAELLDRIILYALPEGFEGLALTCKNIYKLCTLSMERHNRLRLRFHEFTYNKYPTNGLLSAHNPPAVDLIANIAHDPIIARYIKHADFTYDTWPPYARPFQLLPDADLGGPMVTLFANSPYLKEAGLDWREYYTSVQEDIEKPNWYSQHAATFLLTLLPNVTSLKLPCLWQPCEKADKLLNTIIRKAITEPDSSLWRNPSLARLTEFEPYSESGPSGHEFDLARAIPFLALPKLRSFRARNCVATDSSSITTACSDAGFSFGATLETVHFVDSCLDEVAITKFLRATSSLKELAYSHCTKGQSSQDWDICKFVTAVECEAGRYLESLRIEIHELCGSLTPGKASMRGFQRLHKLHFPLELAECNLANDMSIRNAELTDQDLGKLQRLTDVLVPASVSQLSLYSRGSDHHKKALKVIFFDFAPRKGHWVPALEDIRLSLEPNEASAYKEEFVELIAKIEEAGVLLHLGDEEEEDCFYEDI